MCVSRSGFLSEECQGSTRVDSPYVLSQMFPLLLALLFCTISCTTVTMSNDVLPVHA
jgi:hypothetical protein